MRRRGKSHNEIATVTCIDRAYMLVRETIDGRQVLYTPPAATASECWIVATNYWNSPSQYADPDQSFNEKKDNLYASGWRAKRVIIGGRV